MICIVDCRCINLKKNHGISRYTFEIIRNSQDYVKERLVLLSSGKNHEQLEKHFGKSVRKIIKLKSTFLSPLENIEIPYVVNKIANYTNGKVAYFSPSFSSPPIVNKNVRMFITIHDIMHIEFYKSMKNKLYYSTLVKYYIKRANKIFTVSYYSKERILKYYPLARDKVEVVYPGLDFSTFSKLDQENKKKYSDEFKFLPTKFFLFIGNNKPHKNFSYAYKLFKELKKYYPEHKLITNVGFNFKDKEVLFLEKINDRLLNYLYNTCEAFIYPSLYEGFGLPPLEALACGAKVISSTLASLPEVLGNFAIYIDVTKPAEENAKIIAENLTKWNLYYQDVKRFLERYDWRQCSEKIFKYIFDTL